MLQAIVRLQILKENKRMQLSLTLLNYALLASLFAAALACPPHCSDCDADAALCYACDDGHELTVLGSCVADTTFPNCVLYGPPPALPCFACQPTFSLTPNKCAKDYTACLQADQSDDSKCLNCGFGTVLKGGKCIGTINCLDSSTPCKKCMEGFALQGNNCVDRTAGCEITGGNGVCTACKEDYKLIGYQCVVKTLDVYGCHIYDADGICLVCKSGFNLFKNLCLFPAQIRLIQQEITTLEAILAKRKDTNATKTPTAEGNNSQSNSGFTSSEFVGFSDSSGFGENSFDSTKDTTPFSTVNQTVAAISSPQNPPLSIIPNCKTLDPTHPTKCILCLDRFYPSDSGCLSVSPYCQTYNLQTGDCLSCKFNMLLSSGKCNDPNCEHIAPAPCPCTANFALNNDQFCQFRDANCINASLTRCSGCVKGYFITSSGSCRKLPNNCQNANPSTSSCTQCDTGYNLANSQCVPIPTSTSNPAGGSIAIRDPNCAKYTGTTCSACSNRYYANPSNLCVPVNPLCKDYLPSGSCLSCFQGYSLNSTVCVVSKQNDPLCKTYTTGGICTQCYSGSFYSQSKSACQPLNPLCKTFIADGSCTSCFAGYTLTKGNCIVSSPDPNCQKSDPSKGCLQCADKFFLDSANNRCKQMNPLCKTGDPSNGNCLTCFDGYVPQKGTCVAGGASTMDLNCQTKEATTCKKCYPQFFLNPSGKCIQINPLCKTSDQNTGDCLKCYPGYVISNGTCIRNPSPSLSSDMNCKTSDPNGICSDCYSGYRLSAARCLRIDPLCKSYAEGASACDSCYEGYSLKNGQCEVTKLQISLNDDTFCIKSQGATCLTCANGYYLTTTGVCGQLNALCKSSDMTTGYCTQCYSGYVLSGTTCVVAPPVSIPYCSVVSNGTCTSCMSGYFVSKGLCELANTLCASYEPIGGACLSCISGYVYQTGECINPSLGIDSNCQEYSNSYCIKCSPNYALINYWCEAIDPDCSEYDFTLNLCKSCKSGNLPHGTSCK